MRPATAIRMVALTKAASSKHGRSPVEGGFVGIAETRLNSEETCGTRTRLTPCR